MWSVTGTWGAVVLGPTAQSTVNQEQQACRAEKAMLKTKMAGVFRKFAAAADPAPLDLLVGIDGQIRALLRDRPSHRPCETDLELIFDRRWERMGVTTGFWGDLAYDGRLLLVAHRRHPNSRLRAYTLFSTVFGEARSHGLGVMPDIKAAQAYEAEFPSGPFIKDVYLTIANFHKDLFMVLRDRLADYKYQCFAPYIRATSWSEQRDQAQGVALDYYGRILWLTPGDGGIRSLLEQTRRGTIRAWSFCAD